VLIEAGVDWLGVALIDEAIELRNADPSIPILCLGGIASGRETDAIERNITPVIFNLDQAEALNAAAARSETDVSVHVKIDTGMGRLGVRWDQLGPLIDGLSSFSNLRIQGLMTHFASANDPDEIVFTNQQMDRFELATRQFAAAGFEPEIVDLANSPAAVGHPRSRAQMVRLGGIIYGLGGDVLDPSLPQPDLKPVMSLHSAIADIKTVPAGETLGYSRTFRTARDSLIALVPIGYHDGYRRNLSSRSDVLINGKRAPVVGRISMDWTIVDVTDIPNTKNGDQVTLIGVDGGEQIRSEELAAILQTISYEITCGISGRVPRRFVKSAP
jgi:alanine racemase